MKYIPLTQGKFAIVDDEDYDYLMQWKWCAAKDKNTFYAIRRIRHKLKVKQQTIRMHRLLLGAQKGNWCDHVDSNGLNNRRYNIRICTPSENAQNKRLSSQNKSGFKGVCWNKKAKKWQTKIRIGGKQRTIGYYFCLVKAAKAYDAQARKAFGIFARTNFAEGDNL